MTDTQAKSQAEEAALIKKLEAEADAFQARVRLSDAQAAKAAAEREQTSIRAAIDALALERDEEAREAETASNKHHFFYPFTGEVDTVPVNRCIDQLTTWVRNAKGPLSIEVQFNSPGGSVVDGIALFDFLQTVRAEGHYLTTSTIGYAASMAGILLQAGDWRVMGAESWLMIHETSFTASGKFGAVTDRLEWLDRLQKRILHIFADRSTLTVDELDEKWKRKDWWISSDYALELKLVDEVRSPAPWRVKTEAPER